MARKQVSENPVVASRAAAAPARRNSVTPKRVSRPAAVEVPSAPRPEVPPAAPVESLQDAVARLAHSYWEARGCQGGSPEADWFRAEQELSAK